MNINNGNLTNSSINAEAVAVGVGNSVVVNKNTVYNQGGGQHGNGKNTSDGEGVPPIIVIGVALTVLMATGWFFAQYADIFYLTLFALGAAQCLVLVPAIGLSFWYGIDMERPFEDWGACLVSAALAGLAIYGWFSYPVQMSQIAEGATTMKGFWCGLTSYGEALSSQHVLGAVCLAFGNLCVLPQSVRTVSELMTEAGSTMHGWASRLSSPKGLSLGAGLAVATWACLEFAGGPLVRFVDATRMFVCKG